MFGFVQPFFKMKRQRAEFFFFRSIYYNGKKSYIKTQEGKVFFSWIYGKLVWILIELRTLNNFRSAFHNFDRTADFIFRIFHQMRNCCHIHSRRVTSGWVYEHQIFYLHRCVLYIRPSTLRIYVLLFCVYKNMRFQFVHESYFLKFSFRKFFFRLPYEYDVSDGTKKKERSLRMQNNGWKKVLKKKHEWIHLYHFGNMNMSARTLLFFLNLSAYFIIILSFFSTLPDEK